MKQVTMAGNAIILLYLIVACMAPSSGAGAVVDKQQLRDIKQQLPDIKRRLLETEEAPTEPILRYLAATLTAHPDDIDTRCLLGICYDKLGLPDLAQEQFKFAVTAGPDDPHIWIVMIKKELLSGHTVSAQHLIQSAHERFPANAEVLFWYGNCLAAQQKNDQAAYAYQLALNQKQDVAGLRSALAEICIDGMRYGDAVRLAQEEIKRYPNVWIAYKAQGLGYFGLRRKDAAVAPLTVAFEKLPVSIQVCNALAQSLAWCGDYDKALYPALVYLDRTSTPASIDPKAKYLVSQIISKCSNQAVVGINRLAHMVDRQAPNPTFHFSLGDILDRGRHFDQAIDEYRFGLYLSPNYPRGLFRLGADLECYKRNYPVALRFLARAHLLAPEDKQIEACYERLKVRLANRYNDLAWTAKDWVLDHVGR